MPTSIRSSRSFPPHALFVWLAVAFAGCGSSRTAATTEPEGATISVPAPEPAEASNAETTAHAAPAASSAVMAPTAEPTASEAPAPALSGRLRKLAPLGCPNAPPPDDTKCAAPASWKPKRKGQDYQCDYDDENQMIITCVCSGEPEKAWSCVAPG
ncbi:MAG: hypothetical protein HOW73_36480 [Polyangiaceae bacterium]|nr:hypothetical protein [Polyangiaceae bacterium]